MTQRQGVQSARHALSMKTTVRMQRNEPPSPAAPHMPAVQARRQDAARWMNTRTIDVPRHEVVVERPGSNVRKRCVLQLLCPQHHASSARRPVERHSAGRQAATLHSGDAYLQITAQSLHRTSTWPRHGGTSAPVCWDIEDGDEAAVKWEENCDTRCQLQPRKIWHGPHRTSPSG